MNNDLISREVLLNEFNTKCQRNCPTCEYYKGNSKLNRYECELINTAPKISYPFDYFRTMLCGTCQAHMKLVEPERPQDYEESIKAIEISAKKAQEAIEVFKQGLDKAEEQAKQILNGIPTGKWIITSEDTEGIHHIKCPFCKYEKGFEFEPYIKVTFDKLPNFCENCGAKMDGKEADNDKTD